MGQFPLQCGCSQRLLKSWSRVSVKIVPTLPTGRCERKWVGGGSHDHAAILRVAELRLDKKSGQGVRGWVQIALSVKLPSSAAAQPSPVSERAVLFFLRKELRRMDVTLASLGGKKMANVLFLDFNRVESGSYMSFVKQHCSQML